MNYKIFEYEIKQTYRKHTGEQFLIVVAITDNKDWPNGVQVPGGRFLNEDETSWEDAEKFCDDLEKRFPLPASTEILDVLLSELKETA